MPLKPARLFTVGQTYHDFQVTKAIEIPELQSFLRELVHLPTGARVMHLSNEDPENLFCLSFRTLPDSSNGVAHILEHTVLCGSNKYPVKDPFFAMGRRSLNTFMNALTGADFTCYPAASQVLKDFYNLLEVYIDAVFHPNLNELSFLQEGHRLEFAVADNPETSLERKGIVFNEMKGALAPPEAKLTEAMNQALFPNLTYGVNSGGDPKDIPSLTYTQLCAFHQQYYHPSRCLFFFYGNMPLEGHLDFIAKHALKDVKREEPLPPLPMQPRFLEPKRFNLEYPLPPEEDTTDKTIVSFGWLTCHILKQQEVLALCLLDSILMDTDASPLKQAFLRSGLCKQASSYLDVDISELPFIITLKGCNPESAAGLETIMRQTLQSIVSTGIPLELVESALHQLEFSRSEVVGNHAPFGLHLFMRSALLQQHGGNAEDGLVIHSLVEWVHHKHIEDPTYLTGLIQKYLLDNPHFVRIEMNPNQELGAKESAEEKEVLEAIRQELAPGQMKTIIQKAKELADFQKKQEDEQDVDVLPKITLEDVPKFSRDYSLTQEKLGDLTVFHHNCFTNGIIYADIVFDLPQIAEEDLPLVRLLSTLMSQMGTGGRNYAENLEYIQAHTGGVGAVLAFHIQADNCNHFFPSICIHGKALHRKSNKLFPLLRDMIAGIDLTDLQRLKEVILKHYTSLYSALNQNAMRYAINLSASALDVPAKMGNSWYGLDYFWTIKRIAEGIDNELPPLILKLQALQEQLLRGENPHLVLTCDSVMYDELKRHHFYGLTEMVQKPSELWKGHYSLSAVPAQGRIIAAPVAFIGFVLKTIPYIHPDAPALSVASNLFDKLTLHPRIREQGGAYGGGTSNNSLTGHFSFYSYRDPNISSTLNAFEDSVNLVAEGKFDDRDLEEAKLEVVQGMDAPTSPGSRGERAYGWWREGKTLAMRQAYRDKLLSLTSEEVVAAVKRHLLFTLHKGPIVVFAGKELLEKENAILLAQGKLPLPIESI